MTDRPEGFKALKSTLKLDFSAPPAANKLTAQSLQQNVTNVNILSQLLKSPEFERISRDLAQNFQMATPTPTKLLNPQPWEVTNDQKQYAQGFLDALRHIQQLENFKYDNNLVSPSLVTPILRTQTDILQSPLISPTNTLDIQAVMQAVMSGQNALTPVCSASSLLMPKTNNLEDPTSIHSITTSASLSSTLTQALPHSFLQASSSTLSQLGELSQLSQCLPQSVSTSTNSSNTSSIPSVPSIQTNLNLPAPLPYFKTSPQPQPPQPSQPQASALSQQFNQLNKGLSELTGQANQHLAINREIKIEIPSSSSRHQRAMSEDSLSSGSSSTGPSSSGARVHSDNLDGLHVDDQERRKLERKRLRNRMAASKCRQKKLERIADLEQQVNEEKLRSANLDRDIQALRACLEELQKMANYHQQKGCPTHYHRPNVKLVNGH